MHKLRKNTHKLQLRCSFNSVRLCHDKMVKHTLKNLVAFAVRFLTFLNIMNTHFYGSDQKFYAPSFKIRLIEFFDVNDLRKCEQC